MKKLLSLLLALSLLSGLTACGSGSATSSEEEDLSPTLTEEVTTDEDTADEVADDSDEEEPDDTDSTEEDTSSINAIDPFQLNGADFVWNGKYVVWSILPSTASEALVTISDTMGEMMQAAGFTYIKMDAQNSAENQIYFIEDALSAGNVGCLMVAALDADLLGDIVIEAQAQGIAVVYLDAEPVDYEVAGSVTTAYALTGMQAVLAAADWLTNRVAEEGAIPADTDGCCLVAADVDLSSVNGIYCANAIVGTLDASEELTLVAQTASTDYESAYANTLETLSANPTCHIFLAGEGSIACAIADALSDYCAEAGLDLADYCVISCDGSDADFAACYAAAMANPSANAVKGYVISGDTSRNGTAVTIPVATGLHLADALLYACRINTNDSNATWTDLSTGGGTLGAVYYSSITATNVYGYLYNWSNQLDNPALAYQVTTFSGL